MATVNFYLKGALSEERIEILKKEDSKFLDNELKKERQIYLKLSISGERLQIYTKKRVGQYYWDKSKQEVDCKRFKNGGTKLNEWLVELRQRTIGFAEEKELKGIRINSSELHKILQGKILHKPTSKKFEEYFKEFLGRQKNADGHSLSENTLKKYTSFKNQLIGFSKAKFFKLEIARFDAEFLYELKEYLTKDKKLADNTVAKYVKAAKTFIRYYMHKGLIPAYDVTVIKSNEREGEVYVLPIKQVMQLQHHIFDREALNRARDIFCFMCWTGQRYSDIYALKHEDIGISINGEKVWRVITQKTGDSLTVPIIPQAEEILDKYKGDITPLPIMSNQKLNEYLKALGEDIEFDSTVRIVKYYDGRKKEDFVPFYNILTSHIARKSYITNSLILGVPERVVREVSGHKDEKSFRRYVNLAESFKNDAIKRAYNKQNINKFL